MPNDEPPVEDDGIDFEKQQSAQPATVSEAPTDASGSMSPPETPPAPSDDEVRSQWAAHAEQQLVSERSRDAKSNIDTRPPEGEVVSFRSVLIAEIYVGQAADSLTTALGAIEWINSDKPISVRIVEARRGSGYSQVVFELVSDMTQRVPSSYGLTSLPSGIDHIWARYRVIGPAIVAVVFTFVLADDEAKRIDVALREDAESRLRTGSLPGVETVRDIKRKRVRGAQHEVIRRCLAWLKKRMPGTLSTAQEGFYLPTCVVVSVAVGKPFDTQAEYMVLLNLTEPSSAEKFLRPSAEKFVRLPFLFLIDRSAVRAGGWMVAAFNEAEARGGFTGLPEFIEFIDFLVSDLMIVDGSDAVLRSFEPQLRDVRADLNRLDIDKPATIRVIGLRTRLLGLSREISTIGGDVAVLLDDAVGIWLAFWELTLVEPTEGTSATAQTTPDTERRRLRRALETLQGQEVGLRELILITSSAMTETRTLKLSHTLNRLTWVLVVLTVVLVALTVVQLVHTP
jgi:hypothetical protein